MASQHGGDASRTIVGVVVPRNRTDVCQDEPLTRGDLRVDRIESRIVESEPLHVFVDLEPDAAVVERGPQVTRGVRVGEMDRCQRHPVPVQPS